MSNFDNTESFYLHNIEKHIESLDMSAMPIEAEIEFALARNKIAQLNLRQLDMTNAITKQRVAELKYHYRTAIKILSQ